jgi:hypothetical protein
MGNDDKLAEIQNEVRSLKLDDSLLFLNHLLGVHRGFTTNPQLEPEIKAAHPPVLAHVVHFIAKQIILHAPSVGVVTLDWERFQRLTGLCLDLDDPIQNDPEWTNRDPSGFFERLFAQQLGPQNRNVVQKYGIAYGLFHDVGPVEYPIQFDLRAEIETELGTGIKAFMQIAQVAFSLRAAQHQNNPCIGTFTSMLFAESFAQGIQVCVPEVWTPFFKRVACTPEEFRQIAQQPEYQVTSSDFDQFSFNPLWRFPVINLGQDRFLAVDPELVIDRVTFGLFYDIFERDRTNFATRFGHAFNKYVGQLLGAVIPATKLWSAAAWEQCNPGLTSKSGKLCDWAVLGAESTVLIEIKSLRASLPLRTYGDEGSMANLADRLAKAVEQVTVHSQNIQDGKWKDAGLNKGETVGVVLTYGKLNTLNGPSMRKRVKELLGTKGITSIKFVVLSIEQVDMVLRVVEQGHSFDGVIKALAEKENFQPLSLYDNELKECAVSSLTMAKARDILDTIVPKIGSGK